MSAPFGMQARWVDFGGDGAMAGLRARVLGILQLVAAVSSGVGVLLVPAFRHSGTAPFAVELTMRESDLALLVG